MNIGLEDVAKVFENELKAGVIDRLAEMIKAQMSKKLEPVNKRQVVLKKINLEYKNLPQAVLNLALEFVYITLKRTAQRTKGG